MNKNRYRRGFTFVEVCMCVLILSLVFGVATYVMTYARKETKKGFWIQQCISQLRNSTRQIGIKLKEKSYPSSMILKKKTNVQPGEDEYERRIYPYKERRSYNASGRLTKIEVHTGSSSHYEIYAKFGKITPKNEQIELMYFPVCTPSKDFPDSGESYPGIATWTRFVLEPRPDYKNNKLGTLVMEEYPMPLEFFSNDVFDLTFKIDGSSDIHTLFAHGSALKGYRRKELITDVSAVDIEKYDLTIPKGRGVALDGSSADLVNNVVTFEITCTNDKDDKTVLSDMCAITVNSEVQDI